MSPQPEWTAERLDALERDLRDYAERDSGEEHDVEDDCRYQAADAIRHLRQQQPAASTSDEQRARKCLERTHAMWTEAQEQDLAAEFAAVRAAARRAALEEAAVMTDVWATDAYLAGVNDRCTAARLIAAGIRALAAQEVKP